MIICISLSLSLSLLFFRVIFRNRNEIVIELSSWCSESVEFQSAYDNIPEVFILLLLYENDYGVALSFFVVFDQFFFPELNCSSKA